MFTIRDMNKETADKVYGKCNRCEGRISCPESNCLWAAVLAEGGCGKVYCTAPGSMDEEARYERFGR